ncbi:MAG TPA: septum site-determining protein MinC [Rudaea sp.]|nr:septum site-determining protein MinC [Rudaea sp.]
MAAGSTAARTAVELKFGQVGVASVCLRETDPGVLLSELTLRIAAAPNLFRRAPLILDLSRLPALPDAEQTRALLDAARGAGMLPVGLSYGTAENEQLAQMLNLPLFAKFRIAPEPAGSSVDAAGPSPAAVPAATPPGLHHAKPVRSGQQVYARGRDLTVAAAVGSGAEVIADGSIHIYGRLSGRALAGAQGDAAARIYCQDFQAELVSIAGRYRVLEDVPENLRGQAVQAWLDGERLVMEKL